MGKYNNTPGHLTKGMCIAVCQQKHHHPALTQGELKEWLWTTHGVCVTQATISLTLKCSDELLAMATDTSVPPPATCTTYPSNCAVLVDGVCAQTLFLEQQDKVNLNGDMLRTKAARFLQEFHPDAPEMAFSQG
jgi:hypothetical protein